MTTRVQTGIVVLAGEGKHCSCLGQVFTFAVGEAAGESDVAELAEDVASGVEQSRLGCRNRALPDRRSYDGALTDPELPA